MLNHEKVCSTLLKIILNYWQLLWIIIIKKGVLNRRQVFEKYAREKGFDPNDAEGWYKQPFQLIASQEVTKKEKEGREE